MELLAGAIVGGSIISGLLGSRAASKATAAQERSAALSAETMLQAQREANELMREMYYTGRADIAPWRSAGVGALNLLTGEPIMPERDTSVPETTALEPFTPWKETLTPLQRSILSEYKSNPEETLDQYANTPNDPRVLEKRQISNMENYLTQTGGVATPDIVDTIPPGAVNVNPLTGTQASPEYAEGGVLSDISGMIEAGPGEFEESPSYQFTLDEAIKALDRSTAAGKVAPGTAHEKAIMRYGKGLASTEYDNFLRRYYDKIGMNITGRVNPLMAMAGMGQVSAGQTASMGQGLGTNLANIATTTGQNVAQTQLGAGQARASGYINQANALTGGIRGATSGYVDYTMMDTLKKMMEN